MTKKREMTRAVRVGIVGARFAAQFHFEAFRRVHGVPIEIVGVTSKTADARLAFAREKSIRAFDSVAELCAAVDVVEGGLRLVESAPGISREQIEAQTEAHLVS